MKNKFAVALAGALALAAFVPGASADSHINERNHIRHVLLISVDGLHALDVANFVQSHPNSALAELSSHALTYSNARTPSLSDSFPGLLALVTGGSPVSHGLFYDVSYDRAIFDPTNTTCSGSPGNTMVFDESIDLYNSSNVSLNVICTEDTGPLNGQPGGYTDGAGTPSAVLAYGLQKTDDALGSMIQALKDQGIYDSTLFIVSAKHGQSPINPVKVNKPGHFADLVAALPDAGTNAGALAIASAAACGSGPCGFVQDDDIALIWLQDQSQSPAVAAYLNTNAIALFADDVMGGTELKLKFNDPTKDSRTPDIIVQPVYGTIYTASTKKNAEHGGFSFGDTNVGLIVSNPELRAGVLKTPVATSQVAPTILKALGIDPQNLKSVRVEKTDVLPGLPFVREK